MGSLGDMLFSAISASVCGGIGTRCRVERFAGSPHAVSMSASAAATSTGFAMKTPLHPVGSGRPPLCVLVLPAGYRQARAYLLALTLRVSCPLAAGSAAFFGKIPEALS